MSTPQNRHPDDELHAVLSGRADNIGRAFAALVIEMVAANDLSAGEMAGSINFMIGELRAYLQEAGGGSELTEKMSELVHASLMAEGRRLVLAMAQEAGHA